MKIIYQSLRYSPELITGRYVRVCSKYDDPTSIKPNFKFKVMETETCNNPKSAHYGKAGHGYTLREYITDGSELPEALKAEAIKVKTTLEWN